eukprot:scaffold308040_cov42-Prasinocladus_malaysianus.AAC.1
MSPVYAQTELAVLSTPVRLEITPQMASTKSLNQFGGPNLPIVHASVVSARHLVWGMQVQCTHKNSQGSVYFRVVYIDYDSGKIQLKPETFNVLTSQSIDFPAGGSLRLSDGNPAKYGNTEWWSAVLVAPEDADLLDPKVWSLSTPVGSMAAVHMSATYDLLGVSNDGYGNPFKGNTAPQLLKSTLQHGLPELSRNLGLGGIFHFESIAFRLQDKRTGDGSIQALMRLGCLWYGSGFACATIDMPARHGVHTSTPGWPCCLILANS